MIETAPVSEFLPRPTRWRIFFYLGTLVVLLTFGAPNGGLIDIPLSFLLKNKLHLGAVQVADFRLVAAIPLYLSFAFGFARDRWSPLGMGDRGFLIVFGGASAALYVVFAFSPFTYATLLAAIVLSTSSFLFVAGAQSGLGARLGQRHVMSGEVSAVWNIVASVPAVAALLAGGRLSDLLEAGDAEQAARILFLAGAAIMAAVAAYGIWKPKAVFDNLGADTRRLASLGRLLRHRPVYPALLIWLLWNFAPGVQTPLQFFLQNRLHAADAVWGEWNAIFAVSFVPTFLLYGILCRKFPLRRLLLWGTVVAVPQMVPLTFIHSAAGALVAAVPIGLMGGVASAAYIDLIIRSCPPGLHGTTLMLSNSLLFIVSRFGDVLGTWVYDRHGGFSACVAAITLVYALILPALLLVPRDLVASADGAAEARRFTSTG